MEQQSLRPNFNLKIPPVSGRDKKEDANVLSLASLIVRRHSNSRQGKDGERDRSSDQENETFQHNIRLGDNKVVPNLEVPKLVEYKSNKADLQFIGSDGLNTRNSSESHNLSDWVIQRIGRQ